MEGLRPLPFSRKEREMAKDYDRRHCIQEGDSYCNHPGTCVLSDNHQDYRGLSNLKEMIEAQKMGAAQYRQPQILTHEIFSKMVKETFDEVEKLSELKGAEYSGDVDRLKNFRRNGTDLDLPMEVIWRVYAAKHWDAVGQYIRDLHSNKTRVRLEPISGRVTDLIVYLLLFKAMLYERGEA